MDEILDLEIYKEVTEHYEMFYKFQPLTARIYALFVFNNSKEGFTFEEIHELLHSSKSSISHSINTLIQNNFIEQFKQDNERKRYFRIEKNLFLTRLQEVEKKLLSERDINVKISKYRECSENSLFKQEEYDFYIAHLNSALESLHNTIENLKLFINKS